MKDILHTFAALIVSSVKIVYVYFAQLRYIAEETIKLNSTIMSRTPPWSCESGVLGGGTCDAINNTFSTLVTFIVNSIVITA